MGWQLYCFSAADLSIVWAKELPLGFGGVVFSLAVTSDAVYVASSETKSGKGAELALYKFSAADGSLISAKTIGGTGVDTTTGISIADKITIVGLAKSESFTENNNSIVYWEEPPGFESNLDVPGIVDRSVTVTDLTANQGDVTITSTSADNGATVSDTDYGIKIPEYT